MHIILVDQKHEKKKWSMKINNNKNNMKDNNMRKIEIKTTKLEI